MKKKNRLENVNHLNNIESEVGSRWKLQKENFLIFSSIEFRCLLRGVCELWVILIFMASSMQNAKKFGKQISLFGSYKKLMSSFSGQHIVYGANGTHMTCCLNVNRIAGDNKIQMKNLSSATTDSVKKVEKEQ